MILKINRIGKTQYIFTRSGFLLILSVKVSSWIQEWKKRNNNVGKYNKKDLL